MEFKMLLLQFGLITFIYLQPVLSKGFKFEKGASHWEDAMKACDSAGKMLIPGRKYRVAALESAMSDGDRVWMYGWRSVSNITPDANNKLQSLKVDLSRPRKKPSPVICKNGDTYFVASQEAKSVVDGSDACISDGGMLVDITSPEDADGVMGVMSPDDPHWANTISYEASKIKQCLYARKTGNDVKYEYGECNVENNFICINKQDDFSPLVSLKIARFDEFESIIDDYIASQTTSTTTSSTTSTTTTSTTTTTTSKTTTTTAPTTTTTLPPTTTTETTTTTTTTQPTTTTHAPVTSKSTTEELTTTGIIVVDPAIEEEPTSTLTASSSSQATTTPTSTATEQTESTPTSTKEDLSTAAITEATTTTVLEDTTSYTMGQPSSTTTTWMSEQTSATASILSEELSTTASTVLVNDITTTVTPSDTTSSEPIEASSTVSDDNSIEFITTSTDSVVSVSTTTTDTLMYLTSTDTDLIDEATMETSSSSAVRSTESSTTYPGPTDAGTTVAFNKFGFINAADENETFVENIDDSTDLAFTKTSTPALEASASSSIVFTSAGFSESDMTASSPVSESTSLYMTDELPSSYSPFLVDIPTTSSSLVPSSSTSDSYDDIYPTSSSEFYSFEIPTSFDVFPDWTKTLINVTPLVEAASTTPSVVTESGDDVDTSISDNLEPDDYEEDNASASAGSEKAPEQEEGIEVGVWIAFGILIALVVVSVILAFFLYKKRQRQKSKDITTPANGATPAGATGETVELMDSPPPSGENGTASV